MSFLTNYFMYRQLYSCKILVPFFVIVIAEPYHHGHHGPLKTIAELQLAEGHWRYWGQVYFRHLKWKWKNTWCDVVDNVLSSNHDTPIWPFISPFLLVQTPNVSVYRLYKKNHYLISFLFFDLGLVFFSFTHILYHCQDYKFYIEKLRPSL